MYILSQDRMTTINSTALTSINIEKIRFFDPKFEERFPDAHRIVAYGKGEKIYILGAYEDKQNAIYHLTWLLNAMKDNERTYEM